MASYNGAMYIKEQLDSIRDQYRLPDELIIYDDCSTDSTIEIIKEYALVVDFEVKLYLGSKNLGHLKAFEQALYKSTGDLIFISDQDDYWFPQKIKTIESIYLKTGAHIIQNDCYYADSNLNRFPETGMRNVVKTMGKSSYFMSGACTALSKSFLEFILPFPKDHCPQYDIYIHRWANLLDVKYMYNEPLQLWRRHDRNSSNTDTSSHLSISLFDRFIKYKNNLSNVDYVDKQYQLKSLHQILVNKKWELKKIVNEQAICKADKQIRSAISACEYRMKNIKKNKLIRPLYVLWRSICGDYSHFEGFKSIAKDIIR